MTTRAAIQINALYSLFVFVVFLSPFVVTYCFLVEHVAFVELFMKLFIFETVRSFVSAKYFLPLVVFFVRNRLCNIVDSNDQPELRAVDC